MSVRPGKPYRPSNGSEGDWFASKFCERCARNPPDENGADTCEVNLMAFIHEIGEPGYPPEWVYDPDGKPTCTAFRAEGWEPPLKPLPGQMSLFGEAS